MSLFPLFTLFLFPPRSRFVSRFRWFRSSVRRYSTFLYLTIISFCNTVLLSLLLLYHTHTVSFTLSLSLYHSDRRPLSVLILFSFICSQNVLLFRRKLVVVLVSIDGGGCFVGCFTRRIWIFALKTHTHYLSAVNFCHYMARSENLFGLPNTDRWWCDCVVMVCAQYSSTLTTPATANTHDISGKFYTFFHRSLSHATLTQHLVVEQQYH